MNQIQAPPSSAANFLTQCVMTTVTGIFWTIGFVIVIGLSKHFWGIGICG
jgi:hypothetical protein